MQHINQLISKIGMGLATILFAVMLAFAPAQAEAGNFEFGAAFGYAGDVDGDAEDWNGFTFTLDFGYRIIDWVGVYIEQDLGGLILDDTDWIIFYGATMFEAKFVYVMNALELFGKVGIGAVYEADDDSDWDNAWFGLRLGIGATYFMTQSIGIGLNFDYTPSFDDDHVDHFLRFQVHFAFRF